MFFIFNVCIEFNFDILVKLVSATSAPLYLLSFQYELKLQKMFDPMSNARLTPVIDVARLQRYPNSVINFSCKLGHNCWKLHSIQNSIDQIGSYMRPRPSYI